MSALDWAAVAEVALANIEREYPHHEAWLQTGPGDGPRRPREAHPAFYGSFDWHACVEMHWVLVRLLRDDRPGIPRARIRRNPDRSRIGREYSVESLWRSVFPAASTARARAAVSAR